MPRLSANLSTLFCDVPFLERFDRAAKAGFSAVEFQFPYEWSAADIRARMSDADVRLVLFNMPPGDFANGERGIAALPGRENEFRDGVARALDYALDLGCTRLHAMAGIAPPASDPEAMRRTFVDNLRYAAQFAALSQVEILIEPISHQSIPDYFLSSLDEAADILDEAGEDNLFIQYDLYHRSFTGPELIGPYQAYAERIRHIQIAGWPGRHEPDNGDMAWRETLEELDVVGYAGFVGCEYFPAARTEDGLGWASDWLTR
ncbi:MAG: TIM barrel protein [Mesorhizobium sp.]